MTISSTSPRLERLLKRTRSQMVQECRERIVAIQGRPDYMDALHPFLDALEAGLFPDQWTAGSEKPAVMALCIQVPAELLHAAGAGMLRLACGSHTAGNLAPPYLPALTCPMIKSLAGLFQTGILEPENKGKNPFHLIVPFTCDWVTRFSELIQLPDFTDLHYMDLPRLRDSERATRRWLEEIRELKKKLEQITGKKNHPQGALPFHFIVRQSLSGLFRYH